MKRTGFTLIELMIVVAILSILTSGFFVAFPHLFKDMDMSQAMIEENRSLTLAYGKIRDCLKKCRRIANVADGRILFDNDHVIAIEDFGQQLRVNGRLIKLQGRASISDIEYVSDTMFITRVAAGGQSLRILWKTGAADER